MNISSKTKNLINELSVFAGGKLKNIPELSLLIEITERSKKDKLFYDIQFTAKYLNGLGKILQSNVSLASQKKPGSNGEPPQTAEEARKKVMAEYKTNMLKFTGYMKDILLNADADDRAMMEDKFLTLSRTALVNLTTLIYDLSWLKKFYNSKR
jgi:hypothetical protein